MRGSQALVNDTPVHGDRMNTALHPESYQGVTISKTALNHMCSDHKSPWLTILRGICNIWTSFVIGSIPIELYHSSRMVHVSLSSS